MIASSSFTNLKQVYRSGNSKRSQKSLIVHLFQVSESLYWRKRVSQATSICRMKSQKWQPHGKGFLKFSVDRSHSHGNFLCILFGYCDDKNLTVVLVSALRIEITWKISCSFFWAVHLFLLNDGKSCRVSTLGRIIRAQYSWFCQQSQSNCGI